MDGGLNYTRTRECNGRSYYKREKERKEKKRRPGNYYEVLPREITQQISFLEQCSGGQLCQADDDISSCRNGRRNIEAKVEPQYEGEMRQDYPRPISYHDTLSLLHLSHFTTAVKQKSKQYVNRSIRFFSTTTWGGNKKVCSYRFIFFFSFFHICLFFVGRSKYCRL